MTKPLIKEIHVKETTILIDHKTLERIVFEYAMQNVGFYADATYIAVRFRDATEGSPKYKVGTECLVDLSEDQTKLPKASDPE